MHGNGVVNKQGQMEKGRLALPGQDVQLRNEIKKYAFKFMDAPERFHEPQHTADTHHTRKRITDQSSLRPTWTDDLEERRHLAARLESQRASLSYR